MTPIERIQRAAREYADRTAIWAAGTTLKYGEMIERAELVGGALIAAGVRPGDRVAILGERGHAAYVGAIGTLLAGCTYVPLNLRYPVARNRTIIERAEAVALVIDDEAEREFGELCTLPLRVVINPDRDALRDAHPTSWPSRGDHDDCYLIFTSGSTGTPKGVPITNANLAAYLDGILEVLPTAPDDRLTQLADLSFDLSVHAFFVALTTGAAMYCIPDHSNLLATRYVEEHELTQWISVPSTANLAKQAGLLEPGSLPSLRASWFIGEALHGAVASAWQAAAPHSLVYNYYGPTEATVGVSWYLFGSNPDDAASVVSIGVPFRGQAMVVFGPDDRPVPDGEVGELCLAGSQVARGYWRAPELTAEKFVTIGDRRWYRTGDLARRTRKGFEYAGRADHQVKILGFRVELLEIERTLRNVLARESVGVIAWPVSADGTAEGTIAFVAGEKIDIAVALAAARQFLPPYMVPRMIIELEVLPLNRNGKTDYAALRDVAAKHGS